MRIRKDVTKDVTSLAYVVAVVVEMVTFIRVDERYERSMTRVKKQSELTSGLIDSWIR
jgi:hypothetical protein